MLPAKNLCVSVLHDMTISNNKKGGFNMPVEKKVIEKELRDFELDIKTKCLTAEFIDGIILNVKLPLEVFEYYSKLYEEYSKKD